MIELDCESFDSALKTSAAILRMSGAELHERLKTFDYDLVPPSEQQQHPYEDLVVLHAVGCHPDDLPVSAVTFWHHATRTLPAERFVDGILPLPLVVEKLWKLLGELALPWSSTEQWRTFRQSMSGQGAQQYWGKFTFQPGGGPYAFLVRPVIHLGERLGNHDYLGIPEIVEDICIAYEEMCGHDLAEPFKQATRPCIVRFRSSQPWPGALQAALVFLQSVIADGRPSRYGNTCFDGRGTAIPSSDIVGIEWFEA